MKENMTTFTIAILLLTTLLLLLGAAKDNMLPACDGSFSSCVGYGNQKNFGGMVERGDGLPTAQQAEEGLKLMAEAAREIGSLFNPSMNGWHQEAILPVQAYEVGGEIYKDRGEAERVAVERAFLEWYENGADTVLYGRYEGSRIDAEPMLEWVKEHRYVLAKLLEVLG